MKKSLISWVSDSAGSSYDSDYQAWLDQVLADGGTDFATEVKDAQNNLVVGLKDASLWTRMKTGYFLHCGDTTVGRRNLKNPATYRTTLAGALTFSEGDGTKSDGSTGYIIQPFASNEYSGIETDLTAIQYVSESIVGSVGQYSHGMRTHATSNAWGFYLIPRNGTGFITYYDATSRAFTSSNHKGFYVLTYDGSNIAVYKDGTKTTFASTPSAPDQSNTRYILARNVGGSPNGYYTRFLGYDFLFDRFSNADESTLRGLLTTYNSEAGIP